MCVCKLVRILIDIKPKTKISTFQKSTTARRKPSGPRVADPYAEDDSSSMLPIFVAIGAFIPLVFCLCKL